MSPDTVPTENEHEPMDRPIIRGGHLVHDPSAQYAAREEVLRQNGYHRDDVACMTSGEVFTRLAQVQAVSDLESMQQRDQAFFQRHQAKKHQSPKDGGLSVPGIEEAGAWL